MKRIALPMTFVLMMIINLSFAQHSSLQDKRFISVTGSAEIIVQPDEIELEIVLQEFGDKEKKTELKKIENRFFKVLSKNNINKTSATFNNSGYYWYYWWCYRNDYHKRKAFNVKLHNSTDFLTLMQDLDMPWVKSLRISNTTNKRLQVLRKDVKIQAIIAAKEKAKYLLESIDESVGSVISIEEVPNNSDHYWRRNPSFISNVSISSTNSGDEIENVATIKLRYEIKAKFEIEESI